MDERQTKLIEEKYLAALRFSGNDGVEGRNAELLEQYVQKSLESGRDISFFLDGYPGSVQEITLFTAFKHYLKAESLASATDWLVENSKRARPNGARLHGENFVHYQAARFLQEQERSQEAMAYATQVLPETNQSWPDLAGELYFQIPESEREGVLNEAYRRAQLALEREDHSIARDCVELLAESEDLGKALVITDAITDDVTAFILYAEKILPVQVHQGQEQEILKTVDMALNRFEKISVGNRGKNSYSGVAVVEMLVNHAPPKKAAEAFARLQNGIRFLTLKETKDEGFLTKLRKANLSRETLWELLTVVQEDDRSVKITDPFYETAAVTYHRLSIAGLKYFAEEVLRLPFDQIVKNLFEAGQTEEAVRVAEEYLGNSERLSIYREYLG